MTGYVLGADSEFDLDEIREANLAASGSDSENANRSALIIRPFDQPSGGRCDQETAIGAKSDRTASKVRYFLVVNYLSTRNIDQPSGSSAVNTDGHAAPVSAKRGI
jgi:hypothetical protein